MACIRQKPKAGSQTPAQLRRLVGPLVLVMEFPVSWWESFCQPTALHKFPSCAYCLGEKQCLPSDPVIPGCRSGWTGAGLLRGRRLPHALWEDQLSRASGKWRDSYRNPLHYQAGDASNRLKTPSKESSPTLPGWDGGQPCLSFS